MRGFKLIDYDIHCHYNNDEDEIIQNYCNKNEVPVIAISEEAVIEIINGKINRYLGNGIIKIFEK